MLIETVTFEPDTPVHIGGVKECSGFVPTAQGMKTAPVPQSTAKVLADDCRGIDTFQAFASASNTIVAGTDTALYLDTGAGFVDSSDAGGYTLDAARSHDWCFAAFNERIYASSLSELLQSTDGNADFAPVTDSPQARIIVPWNLFLIAFDVDGAWSYRDGWWLCAEADAEDWTPDTGNFASRGRLYATPGPVVAAKALGELIVAFKENGTYVGSFTGDPYKPINWNLLPSSQGAVGPRAVAVVPMQGHNVLFCVGPDSLFVFDGNRQTPLGLNQIQRYFYADMSAGHSSKTQVLVDTANTLVYILYVSIASTDSDILDGCLVWNYSNGRWGVGRDYDARFGLQYTDQTYGIAEFRPAIINSANTIQTLDADPNATHTSSLTTRAYGADDKITHVERMRLRELTDPSVSYQTVDVTHYSADALSFQDVEDDAAPVKNNRADFRKSARWHKDTITVTGKAEFDAVSLTVKQDSDE